MNNGEQCSTMEHEIHHCGRKFFPSLAQYCVEPETERKPLHFVEHLWHTTPVDKDHQRYVLDSC